MKKVLLGILIGVILCVGGLFGYKEFFVKNENPNKKITKTKEKIQKEEDLDLNSQLVQTLYSYVRMEKDLLIGREYISIFDKKNKILATEFNQKLKNYLGYRQLLLDLDYLEAPSYLLEKIYGNSFEIPTGADAWTYSFSEEKLKAKVEMIFGKNSYKTEDFYGCKENGLCTYDSTTKRYYDMDCLCGGTGWAPTTEIKSAKKIGNKIEINEYVENTSPDGEKEEWNLKYTFNLSEDGNYYFKSVEKIN